MCNVRGPHTFCWRAGVSYDQEGLCTNASCTSVVPTPGWETLLMANVALVTSQMVYYNFLHGTVFEKHAGVSADPQLRGRSKVRQGQGQYWVVICLLTSLLYLVASRRLLGSIQELGC